MVYVCVVQHKSIYMSREPRKFQAFFWLIKINLYMDDGNDMCLLLILSFAYEDTSQIMKISIKFIR